MAPPEQVVSWLKKRFEKPCVDPEWLEDCSQWLESDQNISPIDNFPEFMERVKGQLLESDLVDSMSSGTGLSPHISGMTGHLPGPPVLVQILAMTEIGASAFQLEQVRAAREERLLAGIGDIEGEEDGDVEVEGEGPMPKYPRGTLRFQLSDGATTLEAMEYRPIHQFIIGTTPLGFKLHLKGTLIQNGMAMLEPATIVLLGGRQADLEAKQLDDFRRGLRTRLGRPVSPEREVQAPALAVRSPLRDISPPPMPTFPQHQDDVDMEPRRRLPTTSSLNNVPEPSTNKTGKQDRRISGLPSRHTKTSAGDASDQGDVTEEKRKESLAERATLVFAGSQPRSTTSSYFNRNATASGSKRVEEEVNAPVDSLDFNLQPTNGQIRRTLLPTSPAQSAAPLVNADPFDFDFLDEVDQENKPPSQGAANKGKGRSDSSGPLQPPHKAAAVGDTSTSDYGMDDDDDFADPAFFENLDKLEKAALQGTQPPSSGSGSGSVSGSRGSSHPSSSAAIKPLPGKMSYPSTNPFTSAQAPSSSSRIDEVIEIGSDSDTEMLEADDKENKPVATRHVRQRTEDDATDFRPSIIASQLRKPPAMSQRLGRPLVLATKPEDILDLSDSD